MRSPRALPAREQWQALALASAAVVLARIVLTLLAARLLQWPLLKIIGAALLGWVAGGLRVGDRLWADWIEARASWMHLTIRGWTIAWTQVLGAALVVVAGKRLAQSAPHK